ncbi:MAG: O-antigen ligase family protein [Gemmatimonadaceae bacterium]|nr:O-antigen ligase family protein [Gemmatimonadaceae bacterium]
MPRFRDRGRPDSSDAPRPSMGVRLALRLLQLGAILVVLVATPWKQFDLDRFFVPKELVLHATALLATLCLMARARRLPLARVDQFLAVFLALGALAALFSTNWWAAQRAVMISLSGAACFWAARAVARAGLTRALVATLAFAAVLGAITSLLQAYGLRTEYFSLNRAPGGTFGNRNFMAHLAVIAMPALLYTALGARTRGSWTRWCVGIGIVAAALILSRSRAAWLALIACAVVLLPLGYLALRRTEGTVRWRRTWALPFAFGLGAVAALVLPNTLDWKSDSPYLDTAKSVVNYKEGSGAGRLVQYSNTLRMSSHHPLLGVGPGNWAMVYPKFASRNDPSLADNGMTANPWPSSDWMTFLSERGFVAFAVLVLAMVSLLADGVRGLAARDDEERLAAVALIGTIVVLLVVGTFDAVLLLPLPALIAWSLLGALSRAGRERHAVDIGGERRLAVFAAILVLGGIAIARSTTQLLAMELFNGTTRRTVLEEASSYDPGSYRIHLRLAQAYLARGSCKPATAHARAARKLYPEAGEPKVVIRACGG